MINRRSITLVAAGAAVGALAASAGFMLTRQEEPPAITVTAAAPIAEPPAAIETTDQMRVRLRREEAALLALFPGVARRDGETLVIHTDRGDKRLVDRNCTEDDGGGCVEYAIATLYDEGRVVGLREQRHETANYNLIDRTTGTEIPVAGQPLPSPDGRTLAAAGEDGQVDRGRIYGLSIISIDGPMRGRRFFDSGRFSGAGQLRWEDDDCFTFRTGVADDGRDDGAATARHFHAVRSGRKWLLKTEHDPRCTPRESAETG